MPIPLSRQIQDTITAVISGDVEVVQPNPADLNTTIFRDHEVDTATIAIGGNLSDEIDMRSWAGGNLYMPAAWTAADIGFYVCWETGGTFLPFYDEFGALVQITNVAVDQAFRIPGDTFAVGFMKLWSQNAGVNAAQAAERIIQVEFKS